MISRLVPSNSRKALYPTYHRPDSQLINGLGPVEQN